MNKESRIYKKCRRCEGVKHETEFYADPQNKDGLHSWCKSCHKEAKKERKRKEDDEASSIQDNANVGIKEQVRSAIERLSAEEIARLLVVKLGVG